MDNSIYSPTGSPPPPSYEIAQHEFDQKTARVLEESAREPPEPRVDEDGFEVWDEAVFEAALAGMGSLSVAQETSPGPDTASGSHLSPTYPSEKSRRASGRPAAQATSALVASGSSSSSSSGSSALQTRPLNVSKRVRPGKERPSWYEEAGLGATAPNTARVEPGANAVVPQGEAPPRTTRPPRRQLTVMNRDAADPEREVTPPPEFTPVGPSLDGPPYELETVTMTYTGPELEPPELHPPPAFDALPEACTPQSLPPPHAPSPQPPAPTPSPQPEHVRPHPSHAQSLPSNAPPAAMPPARPHVDHAQTMPLAPSRVQPPSMSSQPKDYQPRAKFPGAPRVAFNPQSAYSKPLPSVPQDDEPQPQVFDASAFYSHSVAAHFSTNVPARMRQPVQSDRSSIYSQDSSWPVPTPSANGYGGYGSPPSQAVVSPRPSYAYGQTAFPDAAPTSNDAWRSQHWR